MTGYAWRCDADARFAAVHDELIGIEATSKMKMKLDLRQSDEVLQPPRPQAPGGVYLCQVNERVSCAACCGLYNVADASYAALEAILIVRTESFDRIPREADAIAAFGRQMLKRLGKNAPFTDFHHCPFVGLVGQKQARAGCLLHPLAAGNDGVDFRGLSYYGGMACRVYFCPTHHKLSSEIKTVVRETADNWYEYGLIVTEVKMLKAFFTAVEDRLGAPVRAGDIIQRKECRQWLRQLSRLKIEWPFRRQSDPGPCNYVFDDHLYDKTGTTYPFFIDKPSPYDVIFQELGSGFGSAKDLGRAESIVGGMIDNLALQIASSKSLRIAG
jgi:hypothetical protein